MPDPIPLTPNPTPNLPKAYNKKALHDDNQTFLKNLWRRLFEIRIKAAFYSIHNSGDNIQVKRIISGVNITEQTAINNISQLCKDEASVIADEILKYLTAAQSALHVKVPHTAVPDNHSELVTKFFDIEKGGDSEPRGLIFTKSSGAI